MRRLVHEVLRRLGYRVLVARDGAEALALSQSHTDAIDLLLTDVIMPGMDGRDLAARLQATAAGDPGAVHVGLRRAAAA